MVYMAIVGNLMGRMMTKRFQAARDQHSSWVIIDMKNNPPKIITTCMGHYRSENADFICDALNKYTAPVDDMMKTAEETKEQE
jgi:hypothetical protein